MGLPPVLVQALLIYNVLNMSVPFTRHRYWLHPLLFLVMAVPCLFVLVFGLFSAANSETRMAVHTTDRHHLQVSPETPPSTSTPTSALVSVPKSFEVLCVASVTMTSLCMMALFCMLAWVVQQAERCWAVYVQPMLLDVMVFEKTIWAEADDLRGVVPPEALSK